MANSAASAGALGVEIAAPGVEAVGGVFGGAEVGPAFGGAFGAVAFELMEGGVNEAFEGAAVRVIVGLLVEGSETEVLAVVADTWAIGLAIGLGSACGTESTMWSGWRWQHHL
jgi:hypothetical protein